jgi:hypothetical protein
MSKSGIHICRYLKNIPTPKWHSVCVTMCRYVYMGKYVQVYAGMCQVLVWKYLHIHAIPAHSDIPVHTCNTYLYMHIHANSDNTYHTCNTGTSWYLQYIHTVTYLHIPLAVKYWRDTDTFLHIHTDTYKYPITPKIPAHTCNTCTYACNTCTGICLQATKHAQLRRGACVQRGWGSILVWHRSVIGEVTASVNLAI